MGSLIEPPGCQWPPRQCWPTADKKRAFPREHGVWNTARRRCHDPDTRSFHNYGGRGITMCPEWFVSFDAFIDYIGPRPSPKHTLERIDNDRGYEPGNVRWATWKEQAANKRPPKKRREQGDPLTEGDTVGSLRATLATADAAGWEGWKNDEA